MNATTIKYYLELLKLRISGMIALTAVVAYLAAADQYSIMHMVKLVLVMLLGASSSAVFNHWYDRDIDKKMSRTANRPLARKVIANSDHALWLALALLLGGVFLALLFFNAAVALHLFLGAFAYGVVYTVWLKRRTWFNIILGGLAGSFAVLAGAATVTPVLDSLAFALALILFFWTPSHFWSLAIHLQEEYRKVGIPMLPVVVGEKRAAIFIFTNTLMLVAASMLPWIMGDLGIPYLAGALLIGLHFLYGNWRLIKFPTKESGWDNFIGSMRYLGVLFLVIVCDVNI